MRNSSGLAPCGLSKKLDPHVEVIYVLTCRVTGCDVAWPPCWEIGSPKPAREPDRRAEPPFAFPPGEHDRLDRVAASGSGC